MLGGAVVEGALGGAFAGTVEVGLSGADHAGAGGANFLADAGDGRNGDVVADLDVAAGGGNKDAGGAAGDDLHLAGAGARERDGGAGRRHYDSEEAADVGAVGGDDGAAGFFVERHQAAGGDGV